MASSVFTREESCRIRHQENHHSTTQHEALFFGSCKWLLTTHFVRSRLSNRARWLGVLFGSCDWFRVGLESACSHHLQRSRLTSTKVALLSRLGAPHCAGACAQLPRGRRSLFRGLPQRAPGQWRVAVILCERTERQIHADPLVGSREPYVADTCARSFRVLSTVSYDSPSVRPYLSTRSCAGEYCWRVNVAGRNTLRENGRPRVVTVVGDLEDESRENRVWRKNMWEAKLNFKSEHDEMLEIVDLFTNNMGRHNTKRTAVTLMEKMPVPREHGLTTPRLQKLELLSRRLHKKFWVSRGQTACCNVS